MRRIDVVYSVILDPTKQKVLMVKDIGQGAAHWSLPGGGVEAGETLRDALIRETREETGLLVEMRSLMAVNERIFDEQHVLFFTFWAEVIGGSIDIQYPEEIEAIEWLDLHQVDELLPYFPERFSTLIQTNSSALYHLQF